MPHLLIPRKGWQNERLASYLLSRFSFVAHPSSIADDLGSDFFCTIFEVENTSGRDVLVPRNSFAIQVKSSSSKIVANNKIDYLMRLELPLFIGVVNQVPAEMKIYSAEFLPILFSDVGKPNGLSLIPVDMSDFDPNAYCERLARNKVRLRCPLVATLRVDDDLSVLASTVRLLISICTRALTNIGTRINEEHIYKVDESGHYRIVAGPGSALYFRKNFLKRLGEVFKNLEWSLASGVPREHVLREFDEFERLYRALEKDDLYKPQFAFASNPYKGLKAKLTMQSSLRKQS